MKRQKTFDDSEPVIDSVNLPGEKLTTPNEVKPRSRNALEVYDEIEAARLIEDDPLYDC